MNNSIPTLDYPFTHPLERIPLSFFIEVYGLIIIALISCTTNPLHQLVLLKTKYRDGLTMQVSNYIFPIESREYK